MDNTLLNLEGKCLLLLQNSNKEVEFYCNGFNTLKALFLLPEAKEIKMEKMLLEVGEGDSYKSWTENDFAQIKMFSEVKKIFEVLPADVFIYDLKFKAGNLSVSIHDNREFNISSDQMGLSDFNTLIKLLLSKVFLFSNEICTQLIQFLNDNKSKYVLINEEGKILSTYKNFDDYLSVNQN